MKEELLFCPLGGSGEIGMNMNLFAYGNPDNKKWIMVDIGVTFADDTFPGIDLIYPDPGFITDKKDDLLGIVLTHAHEDHIGAIAHLWPKLKCKIFATPFTAILIREKFKEKKIDITNNLQIVDLNGTINLDNFKIIGCACIFIGVILVQVMPLYLNRNIKSRSLKRLKINIQKLSKK